MNLPPKPQSKPAQPQSRKRDDSTPPAPPVPSMHKKETPKDAKPILRKSSSSTDFDKMDSATWEAHIHKELAGFDDYNLEYVPDDDDDKYDANAPPAPPAPKKVAPKVGAKK